MTKYDECLVSQDKLKFPNLFISCKKKHIKTYNLNNIGDKTSKIIIFSYETIQIHVRWKDCLLK